MLGRDWWFLRLSWDLRRKIDPKQVWLEEIDIHALGRHLEHLFCARRLSWALGDRHSGWQDSDCLSIVSKVAVNVIVV